MVIEDWHDLVVDTDLLQANGTAERDATLIMAERLPGSHRRGKVAEEFFHWPKTVAGQRKNQVSRALACWLGLHLRGCLLLLGANADALAVSAPRVRFTNDARTALAKILDGNRNRADGTTFTCT